MSTQFEQPLARPISQEDHADILTFLKERGFKLDPEIKEQWLTALRSNTYKQGTTFLRGGTGKYCCMGVLGVVIDIDKDKLTGKQHLSDLIGCSNSHILPPRLESFLAACNDGALMTFEQIADWVEGNL